MPRLERQDVKAHTPNDQATFLLERTKIDICSREKAHSQRPHQIQGWQVAWHRHLQVQETPAAKAKGWRERSAPTCFPGSPCKAPGNTVTGRTGLRTSSSSDSRLPISSESSQPSSWFKPLVGSKRKPCAMQITPDSC